MELRILDLSDRDKFLKWEFKNNLYIGKVILPPIEKLDYDLFFDSINLRQAVFSEGLKHIGKWCFGNCINLDKIELPSTVEYIDCGAFQFCSNVSSVVFKGNKLKTISENAFTHLHKLKELVIPDGVETIETSAFNSCVNLEIISLPESIKNIEELAFKNCPSIKKIIIRGIPDKDLQIKENAFFNCIRVNYIDTKSKRIPIINDVLFIK